MTYSKLTMTAGIICAGLMATSAQAVPVQFEVSAGGNGHYYEVVDVLSDFDTAFSNAASSTFNGLQGYLATITSAAEQTFLESQFGTTYPAWIGASDENSPQVWSWINGPEAGFVFYDENATVQPGFSFWNAGEPNGASYENHAVFRQWGTTGAWNDSVETSLRFALVEYGGIAAVPVPASVGFLLTGAAGFAGMRSLRKAKSKA